MGMPLPQLTEEWGKITPQHAVIGGVTFEARDVLDAMKASEGLSHHCKLKISVQTSSFGFICWVVRYLVQTIGLIAASSRCCQIHSLAAFARDITYLFMSQVAGYSDSTMLIHVILYVILCYTYFFGLPRRVRSRKAIPIAVPGLTRLP